MLKCDKCVVKNNNKYLNFDKEECDNVVVECCQNFTFTNFRVASFSRL